MPTTERLDWGSITEVIPGKKYVLRFTADTGDGRGKMRHSVTFLGTKREARRELARLRTLYDRGRTATAPTVSAIWQTIEARELEKMARRSKRNACVAWSAHVQPRWGDVRVDTITSRDVEAWLSDMSVDVAKKSLAVLRKVTHEAFALGRIDRDALDTKMRMPEREEGERRVMLDAAPYLDCVRGTQWEAAFILCAAAGCRVGEALGVTPDHVVQDGSIVRVAIVDEANERGELEGRLKNKQSRRTCAVAGALGSRLIELRDAAAGRGDKYLTDDGFGRPSSTRAFSEGVQRLQRGAGLPVIEPRALRPSFSTAMLRSGADPQMINRLMGHTPNSDVLWQHYDRLPDDAGVPAILPIWDI